MSVMSVISEFADQGRSGAEMSECGLYRYSLWRRWSGEPAAVFIGLNPSTADGST
ncbi:MAG: DUF1643 domain-containing protein, partial [Burkholderiaceae bacterium]